MLFLWSVPSRVPLVTEEVAREALLSFVSSKCCYGSTVAGDLIIQGLKQQTLCRVRGPGACRSLGMAQALGPGGDDLCEFQWEKGVLGAGGRCM